jgi:hypothetical protein
MVPGREKYRIPAKHYEDDEGYPEKLAKLWLECNSTTTQQALNKANGGIKYVKPVEFSRKITKMRSYSR